MDTQIYICSLYDYYKELLTDKQKECFEDYYFDNLTQEEIADNNNISKNAVSKTLLEVKEKLEDYENKLHLFSNQQKIKEILDNENVNKIINYI